MAKIINFVLAKNLYINVVRSIIDPIIIHLPESTVSYEPLEDAINIDLLRKFNYTGTSVFMSHGIADKRWRNGQKVKKYDYICVSGPLWEKKMIREGIPDNKILTVGYSKLDPIFQGPISKTSNSKKQILWAPTHNIKKWTIADVSSYPGFSEYLNKLPSEFDINTSLHPGNKANKKPILQELIDADVVISDCSSIMYEAWALDKPVIFPDWLVKDKIIKQYPKSFEKKIYNEEIGYHAKDITELIDLIYIGLEKGIDKKAQEFIEGILPKNLRGTSGYVTAQKLRELAERD